LGKSPRHNQTKFMRVSKEDKKVVQSVKNKIKRLQKVYGIDLSNEIKLPDLTKTTRAEFKKFKEFQKSFTNRAKSSQYSVIKSDNGTGVLKKELDEIKLNYIKSNEKAQERKEKRDKMQVRTKGKNPVSIELQNAMMKRPRHNRDIMGDFDLSKIKSRKQFEERLQKSRERLEPNYHNERLEKMRESYFEKLRDVLGDEAEPIILMILDMNVNDFYELYLRESKMQFSHAYIAEGMEDMAEEFRDEIAYYIELYNEGHYDDGLSNFPNKW